MKRNITKQLCICVAVYERLTASLALELALPEEEIPKHVCPMQCQFKVFKNMNYFEVYSMPKSFYPTTLRFWLYF